MTRAALSRLERNGSIPATTVLDRIANAIQATDDYGEAGIADEARVGLSHQFINWQFIDWLLIDR
jgi:hypothetical protein